VFANSAPSYALFVPAFAGVGVGGSLIWTAQGIYVSRCAIKQAEQNQRLRAWREQHESAGSSSGGGGGGGGTVDTDRETVDTIMPRYNGYFWTIFQFNGAAGLSVASTILTLAPDYRAAVKWLYLGFGFVGCAGLLLILVFMKPLQAVSQGERGGDEEAAEAAARGAGASRGAATDADDENAGLLEGGAGGAAVKKRTNSSGAATGGGANLPGAAAAAFGSIEMPLTTAGSGPTATAGTLVDSQVASARSPDSLPRIGLFDTLRLMRRSKTMLFLVPILLYNGASLGFFSAQWPLAWEDYCSPALAAEGECPHPLPRNNLWGKTYAGYVAAFAFLTNSLLSFAWGKVIPKTGLRLLFGLAMVTMCAFYPMVIMAANGTLLRTTEWGSGASLMFIFGGCFLFMVGDSVLESQVPSIIQSPAFFPDERDRESAIALLRMWHSLGFTLQFIVGIVTVKGDHMVPSDAVLQASILLPLGVVAVLLVFALDRFVQPIDSGSDIMGCCGRSASGKRRLERSGSTGGRYSPLKEDGQI
jgi:hypothetical protein